MSAGTFYTENALSYSTQAHGARIHTQRKVRPSHQYSSFHPVLALSECHAHTNPTPSHRSGRGYTRPPVSPPHRTGLPPSDTTRGPGSLLRPPAAPAAPGGARPARTTRPHTRQRAPLPVTFGHRARADRRPAARSSTGGGVALPNGSPPPAALLAPPPGPGPRRGRVTAAAGGGPLAGEEARAAASRRDGGETEADRWRVARQRGEGVAAARVATHSRQAADRAPPS